MERARARAAQLEVERAPDYAELAERALLVMATVLSPPNVRA